jgi:hypothetical protein
LYSSTFLEDDAIDKVFCKSVDGLEMGDDENSRWRMMIVGG